MKITRDTIVKDAVESCPEAPAIFEAHGIDPRCKCKGMWDVTTLDEAADWCKIKDVDGLIAELEAALNGREVAKATPR